MSYYDVDAILTDAEKVPCRFELDVPHLGHLESTTSTGLKPGTALSLPLWLAEMLALATAGDEGKAPLTLNHPPCLSEKIVAALKADARAVSLRDQSAHFFGIGVRMLELFDDRELGNVLRSAFVLRATEVGLHARKAEEVFAGQGHDFLRGLDEWERAVFRNGHEGVKATKEWMDRVNKG
ncbi:DNA replication complex GINS protein psf-3 [Ophiocordyceps camponoti-floridani]|uniref:DNA replication complex GINS protein PSF3 n=1 Tax=Ophiocordyceps camponoti-floridani TaxID=2030778 RepID=A0A8H4Q565_9HYPO|nr:DNA replication complex GINS protein psf-3 [Ophiocordyceps camponoti-floridani]